MLSQQLIIKYPWKKVKNVDDPKSYSLTFDSDEGYFTEDNNERNFTIANGVLAVPATDYESLTHIHVFEKNVKLTAKLRLTEATPGARLGLCARQTCEDAWVKLFYEHDTTHWYIAEREGVDFPVVRHRIERDYVPEKSDIYNKLEIGKLYEISLTVDGETASVYIDGEFMFTVNDIAHLTPGRIGIFAEKCAVEVESFDFTLLSGQGTVWKNCFHTRLPDELYREGGSVFEMNDKSLIFTHHSEATFTSRDNGKTWERRDKWTDTHGYVNILRLINGDFMKMIYRTEDDGCTYVMSQTSSDDGATWVDGGKLLRTPYGGNTTANAGNMNDKITQLASGRIFYGMNYECAVKSAPVKGKYIVFCEFYYSDDNGKTWTKSETDSWDIPGNESQAWFGECKILECADGSLRMYNSWNDHGCVVYSESFDGGKTWGRLIPMPELVCARSSMQFHRDLYADNDTTYYMVWVYSEPMSVSCPMTRSRLSLARSVNGKDWDFLGDIWRWESPYMVRGSHIAHVVDAFVKTTKDYVITGAGYSEKLTQPIEKDNYHHAQRQHIYSIPKSELCAVPLTKV